MLQRQRRTFIALTLLIVRSQISLIVAVAGRDDIRELEAAAVLLALVSAFGVWINTILKTDPYFRTQCSSERLEPQTCVGSSPPPEVQYEASRASSRLLKEAPLFASPTWYSVMLTG